MRCIMYILLSYSLYSLLRSQLNNNITHGHLDSLIKSSTVVLIVDEHNI